MSVTNRNWANRHRGNGDVRIQKVEMMCAVRAVLGIKADTSLQVVIMQIFMGLYLKEGWGGGVGGRGRVLRGGIAGKGNMSRRA